MYKEQFEITIRDCDGKTIHNIKATNVTLATTLVGTTITELHRGMAVDIPVGLLRGHIEFDASLEPKKE